MLPRTTPHPGQLHQIRPAWRRIDGHHDRRRHPHHPWRRFAGLSDWTLHWTDALPNGTWGRTLFGPRVVLMSTAADQAQRRCTIAHETEHIIRGPLPHGSSSRDILREELAIDRDVARLLVPDVHRVGHALAWAQAHHDVAADELWVDVQTLEVRLSALTKTERAWLDNQLAGVLV